MPSRPDDDTQLLSRLEQIVTRMQDIQRAISAVGAPPSLLEIGELKELGLEYAELIERLKAHRNAVATD